MAKSASNQLLGRRIEQNPERPLEHWPLKSSQKLDPNDPTKLTPWLTGIIEATWIEDNAVMVLVRGDKGDTAVFNMFHLLLLK